MMFLSTSVHSKVPLLKLRSGHSVSSTASLTIERNLPLLIDEQGHSSVASAGLRRRSVTLYPLTGLQRVSVPDSSGGGVESSDLHGPVKRDVIENTCIPY